MEKRHRLREHELPDDQFQQELVAAFGPAPEAWRPPDGPPRSENRILVGRVLRVCGEEVWIDIGSKSPGTIHLREWYDAEAGRVVPPQPGDAVPVLLMADDDATGTVVLSRREAVRWQRWTQVADRYREGDVVRGTVTRVVRGGLLVDIGFEAFLPASQVDVRRPANLEDYVGRDVECTILRVDAARRAILLSRRRLIENEEPMLGGSQGLLAAFEPGQVRVGVVKNIAEFGAFIDLGGIEGLLHITDMAWHRVSSPHAMVHIDQRLEVYVLSVDRERAKITLSLKHLTPSPWASVAEKYPVGSRHRGQVINLMSYGAFVRLEPGIEGLVHVSEMSWARRINHPSELLALGDQVEVQVLRINKEKQEISLGLKQAQLDPAWRTPAVLGLARSIAEERCWGLPILADALEEAGCTDTDLLSHLRGPGPHVCGDELIAFLIARPEYLWIQP